jgi:hypothetical protein
MSLGRSSLCLYNFQDLIMQFRLLDVSLPVWKFESLHSVLNWSLLRTWYSVWGFWCKVEDESLPPLL